jgi:uncharacterized membrane protein
MIIGLSYIKYVLVQGTLLYPKFILSFDQGISTQQQ